MIIKLILTYILITKKIIIIWLYFLFIYRGIYL